MLFKIARFLPKLDIKFFHALETFKFYFKTFASMLRFTDWMLRKDHNNLWDILELQTWNSFEFSVLDTSVMSTNYIKTRLVNEGLFETQVVFW